MPRPCVCAHCGEYIVPRGNEIPWAGNLTYHRACYESLRSETPDLPTVQEIEASLDAVREMRT